MRRTLIAAAGLLVLVAGGAAWATIPAADGTFTACVKADGTLRLVDAEAGATCKASEQPVTWSKTGPTGPTGPQGPPGPQGPSGLSNVQHVGHDFFGPGQFAGLNCSGGQTAIDASAEVVDNNTGEMLPVDPRVGVEPVLTAGRPTGYRFAVETSFSSGHHRFHITCATTS